MRRLWHRVRYGHWANVHDYILGEAREPVRICGLCLARAYEQDERRIGGGGW